MLTLEKHIKVPNEEQFTNTASNSNRTSEVPNVFGAKVRTFRIITVNENVKFQVFPIKIA